MKNKITLPEYYRLSAPFMVSKLNPVAGSQRIVELLKSNVVFPHLCFSYHPFDRGVLMRCRMNSVPATYIHNNRYNFGLNSTLEIANDKMSFMGNLRNLSRDLAILLEHAKEQPELMNENEMISELFILTDISRYGYYLPLTWKESLMKRQTRFIRARSQLVPSDILRKLKSASISVVLHPWTLKNITDGKGFSTLIPIHEVRFGGNSINVSELQAENVFITPNRTVVDLNDKTIIGNVYTIIEALHQIHKRSLLHESDFGYLELTKPIESIIGGATRFVSWTSSFY